MKIAFINYNMGVQLVKEKARSNGDFAYSVGLFKIFLSNPENELELYTSMDVKSEKLFNSDKFPEEWSFLKSDRFRYLPAQKEISPDIDIVYINSGPTNLMYGDRYWKISNIVKCYKLLQSYKGVVIFTPGEVEIEMVFFLENFNPNLFIRKNLVSSFDLVKDKTYVLTTKAFNTEKFYDYCTTYRNLYRDLRIPIEYWNESAIPLLLLDRLYPKENPEYNIVYIGNKRLICSSYRANNIRKYLSLFENSNIWGDWVEDDVKDFSNITINGKLNYGDVCTVLNNSRYSLVFTDHQYEKDSLRVCTNRTFEIIRSGCIPIFFEPAAPTHVIKQLPDFLIFSSEADLQEKMKYLDSMSFQKIVKLSNYLNTLIEPWCTPERYLEDFTKIANKYIEYHNSESAIVLQEKRSLKLRSLLNSLVSADKIKSYNDVIRILGLRELYKNFCNSDGTANTNITNPLDTKLDYIGFDICQNCSRILNPIQGLKGRTRTCDKCGGSRGTVSDNPVFDESVEILKKQFSEIWEKI